ncbi:uncharacterized protein [Haliotis cracherodii]|uniref:uncharacterized protein n=1 Tax=Haliotis cracherodii TaxID=6455 RepID=UPI0039ECD28D
MQHPDEAVLRRSCDPGSSTSRSISLRVVESVALPQTRNELTCRQEPGETCRYDMEKLDDKQLVSDINIENRVKQSLDFFREKEERKILALKQNKIWSELPPFPRCTGKEKKALGMCNDTAACKHPLPAADSQENIRNILTPVTKLQEGALGRIKDVFNIQERRKYAFVTAASADHFDESQEMIMTLDKYIFPHLRTYSFYYYDMGLNRSQVKLDVCTTNGVSLKNHRNEETVM